MYEAWAYVQFWIPEMNQLYIFVELLPKYWLHSQIFDEVSSEFKVM